MARTTTVERPRSGLRRDTTATSRPSAERTGKLPPDTWDRIARKAYELYEGRDRDDGWDLNDWLEAESIIMEEIHETRE